MICRRVSCRTVFELMRLILKSVKLYCYNIKLWHCSIMSSRKSLKHRKTLKILTHKALKYLWTFLSFSQTETEACHISSSSLRTWVAVGSHFSWWAYEAPPWSAPPRRHPWLKHKKSHNHDINYINIKLALFTIFFSLPCSFVYFLHVYL